VKTQRALFVSVLTGAVALAVALPAQAQNASVASEVTAPDYGSGASVGGLSNRNFNTAESDGRPGVYYFDLGVQAFKKGDYRHAIDMYKVAASWAYKPAEYNLGIMYFKGQGIPADRARGAAWMILAAERGDPLNVKARDLMVTALTKPEFQQTDEIWNQLKPTYADAVALQRAKARWAQTKASATGTRVGATGSEYLMVGSGNGARAPALAGANPSLPITQNKGVPLARNGGDIFKNGDVTDGSIAYKQFQKSDNPYDPAFVNNRIGTVAVEPLQPVKSGSGAQPSKKDNPASSSSSGSHPAAVD